MKRRKPAAGKPDALKLYKEAVRQQAATAGILSSISRGHENPQPVFDAIVQGLRRLFRTRYAVVALVENGHSVLKALAGDKRFIARIRAAYPWPIGDDRMLATRAIRSGRVLQICPIAGNPRAPVATAKLAKELDYDSIIVAPLLRAGAAIGFVVTARIEPKRFNDSEVALIKSFADQAVIAIENARLFNETKEALERQTATADILSVIAGSPSDVQPVFDTISRNALRLCGSLYAIVHRFDGELIHYASSHHVSPEQVEIMARGYPRPPDHTRAGGRAILSKSVICIEDTLADPDYDSPATVAGGWRRILAVPILRDGDPVGDIVVGWAEPGPIPKVLEELLKTFADQAVIAIENVRLFNETKEALERQTATAEILKAIASSPSDVQPVFESIAERAAILSGAKFANVTTFDGELIHLRATYGPGSEEHQRLYPMRPGGDAVSARVVRERGPVQIEDVLEDPEYTPKEAARHTGYRSGFGVPMMQKGRVLGAIALARPEPGAIPDKVIRLLQTFADQAVIAIENARLFNETKEALERQTATSEVLKTISRSTFDLNAVLQVLIENATRLAGAKQGFIFRFDGKIARLAYSYNAPPAYRALIEEMSFTPGRGSMVGRVLLEGRPVHIPDALADREFTLHEAQRAGGFRSMLGVPMMREGKLIGVIAMWTSEVRPFTEKQIELVSTFADQAVIAIENVRLFNETKEALEQQTATADILRVIASSPGDVQPVFEAIVESALRLCGARFGRVYRYDGSVIQMVASQGLSSNGLGQVQRVFPRAAADDTIVGRAILTKLPQFVRDIEREDRVPALSRQMIKALGTRSQVTIPMLRSGEPIGAITMGWVEPEGFDGKQVTLLETFADQAVIAIENVRLFNETKEALERQTATAAVLNVISNSPTDVQPVFDTIAERAATLCGARFCTLSTFDGELIHMAAIHGTSPQAASAVRAAYPMKPGSATLAARVIQNRGPLHIADVLADPEYAQKEAATKAGFRSVLGVPMMREGELAGVIIIGREEVGHFPDKEVDLLKTFADQAAIAIQNVRLFNEIREKSALLEVANKHKSEFLANMSHELRTPLNAVIGFSEVLSDRMFGEINEKQADYLKDIHESGKHLLSLINDILDLSKIEAGRMELDLATFHLPSAISNAMTLIRERAQRHGIQLGAEIDPRLGEFQADERKLKQILLNLLSNAVKFTPDGGRVDVNARLDSDKIFISVRDTGVGISPEDQAALFEEFRQVGKDAGRRAEGTGLGLALAKRFVELHGGEIRLESAPGRGSTFTFSLPVRA